MILIIVISALRLRPGSVGSFLTTRACSEKKIDQNFRNSMKIWRWIFYGERKWYFRSNEFDHIIENVIPRWSKDLESNVMHTMIKFFDISRIESAILYLSYHMAHMNNTAYTIFRRFSHTILVTFWWWMIYNSSSLCNHTSGHIFVTWEKSIVRKLHLLAMIVWAEDLEIFLVLCHGNISAFGVCIRRLRVPKGNNLRNHEESSHNRRSKS